MCWMGHHALHWEQAVCCTKEIAPSCEVLHPGNLEISDSIVLGPDDGVSRLWWWGRGLGLLYHKFLSVSKLTLS